MALGRRDVERALLHLFRRCVECPELSPSCPACGPDEICTQIAASCDRCASTACIRANGPSDQQSSNSGSNGPNIGAIVGGVIGGIAFILLVTYLFWRFCLKGKRRPPSTYEEEWEVDEEPSEKEGHRFTMRRDARSSTHTVASMASTVLTRASNIIQIAYIPGVTNRSGPSSPGPLVPPVPPIPAAMVGTPPGTPFTASESHYFMPSDLRDSTYSGYTDSMRDSYATRTSLAPSLARTSVATTIYRQNAVVSPTPAQQVVRGKAAVVSVKGDKTGPDSGFASSGDATPPVPALDVKKINNPVQVRVPSSSDEAPMSPPSSIKSSATFVKPVALNIIKKAKPGKSNLSTASSSDHSPRDELAHLPPITHISHMSYDTDTDSETDEPARSQHSLLYGDQVERIVSGSDTQGTPDSLKSPFSDENKASSPLPSQNHSSPRLESVREESDNRARSPFGDENDVEKIR